MNKLPLALNKDIVVQNAGKELLIYNLITNKAYNLNETSTIVYQACNGKQTFDDLKRQHKFTDDLIHLAIDELKANNLIESEVENHFAGLSRRETIRRVGLASMIALPVIIGLTAPKAIQAASDLCAGVVCDDNNACTFDSCDPATGGCIYETAICDDGDPCTSNNCGSTIGCFFTPVVCVVGQVCSPIAGGCVPIPR